MHKRLKMVSLKPRKGACVLALAGVLTVPSLYAAEDWFLMGRNGQCMEMGALFAKMPDLAKVSTPKEYIAIMEAKGNELDSKVTESEKGKMHQVRVAAKGLTLTFVEPGVCPL